MSEQRSGLVVSWWARPNPHVARPTPHAWVNESERTLCGTSVEGMSFLSTFQPDGICCSLCVAAAAKLQACTCRPEAVGLGCPAHGTLEQLCQILGAHFYEGSQCSDDGDFSQCDCDDQANRLLADAWDAGAITRAKNPPGTSVRELNPYRTHQAIITHPWDDNGPPEQHYDHVTCWRCPQ